MKKLTFLLGMTFVLMLASCGYMPTKYSSVYDAAVSGDGKDLARLIERGSPLNVRGDSGATALHIAAFHNDTTAIGMLLRAGADLHLRDDFGRVPLGYAALSGATLAASLLLQSGQEILTGYLNSYQTAVARNDAAFVDTLLEHGADPMADFGIRGTPLEWAIYNDADQVVRLLATHGIDVRAPFKDSTTPLHLAAQAYTSAKTQTHTLDVLLDLGADPNAQDSLGRTPLHMAVMYGYPETVTTLVLRGADPLAKAHDGTTPEQLAVQRAEAGDSAFLSSMAIRRSSS